LYKACTGFGTKPVQEAVSGRYCRPYKADTGFADRALRLAAGYVGKISVRKFECASGGNNTAKGFFR